MHFDCDILELRKINQKISDFTCLNITKDTINANYPINDYEIIALLLIETETTRKLIVSYGEIFFGGITNIGPAVILAEKGIMLSSHDLVLIKQFINGCKNITAYKKSVTKVQIEVLEKYFNFMDLNKVKSSIEKCIDDNYNIYDNASLELNRLRNAIRAEENKMRAKLQELMQKHSSIISENIIVLRNDRLCLCIKAEHKNNIKGIIHDESGSKTTVYIEPSATYEISNKISNLQNNEKKEIEKILLLLSKEIEINATELLLNLKNVIYLDFLSAKAKYAIYTNSIMPIINKDGIITLEASRHPLIDPNKIIPLSIHLGSEFNTIVITGPNTGGKTVALKTVGLLTLMMQSGNLVPAKKAEMAVFDNVFADIGDEQSIEQSLSTFSSHMGKIINIVNKVSNNSLILLDELGGGTDPKEGTSLAIALLNYFSLHNARIIITTHYSELKAYAYETSKTINASMEFDCKTYQPTYRLLIGVSGKSNAFEISKHLGLKKSIIEEANNYLSNNNSEANILMQKIETRGHELENRISEYKKLIEENIVLNKQLEEKNNYFMQNEKSIIQKSKEKADQFIKEKTKQAEELILEIEKLRNENVMEHTIAEIKHQVKTLNSNTVSYDNNQDFNVGDYVTVIPYDCFGQITKITKDKYRVQFGNLNADFTKKELIISNELPKEIKKTTKSSMVITTASSTLDMRGYRYEEALAALEKFIDNAIMANLNSVTIIHGFGTGVLRKGVWEYLNQCKTIKSHRYGGQGEGLNGVTIAYLK